MRTKKHYPVDDHGAASAVELRLHARRCPSCGGLVIPPCGECRIRAQRALARELKRYVRGARDEARGSSSPPTANA